jgi:hypothetical protein
MFKKNNCVNTFNMKKLEIEYDYSTDHEQITRSVKMLNIELTEAINFFVCDDPLKLVENL